MLAKMIGKDGFAAVRLTDRSMLLSLQERIMSWLREAGDARTGVELYQDVVTTAELLRSINRRQELQLHDAALLDRLVPQFEAGSGHNGRFRELLAELDALAGLDDQLDELRYDARVSNGPTSLAESLIETLKRIRSSLPGARAEVPSGS